MFLINIFNFSAQVNVVHSNIASIANTLVLLPYTIRSFKYSEFGYLATFLLLAPYVLLE